MRKTTIAVLLLLSVSACGRGDRGAEAALDPGAAASLSRAAPASVAGGSNHYNVWPTGDAALDVSDVQWALDHVRAGGVVLLKSADKFTGEPKAFEFGDDGSVTVPTSVSIQGEVDDAGAPLVTIHGGFKTFTCDDPTVAIEIASLRFDGPKRAAIYVRQSASARIAGNVMFNLRPAREVGYPNVNALATPPVAFNGIANYAASGVEMGLLKCDNPDPTPPNACHDVVSLGRVAILNNWIDVGVYDATGALLDPTKAYPNAKSDGTPLEDTVFSGIVITAADATARIAGNTVKNGNRRSIHALDTFGTTEIVDNTVFMGPFSAAGPGQATPGGSGKRNFGIFPLNGNRNPASATDGATHTVMRNIVYLNSDVGPDGPHGNALVTVNGAHDLVFSDNTIVYQSGARNAIVLGGNNSSVKFVRPRFITIARNTIDASSHPLDSSSTPAHILLSLADSTTIVGNTYLGTLPKFVILGLNTNVVDAAHPNTIVDAYCGPPSDPANHPYISFANLFSCTQP